MKKLSKKKIIILVIVLVAILLAIGYALSRPAVKSASDTKSAIQGPRASITLNKELSIPLKSSKDEKLGELKYIIESAELRDQIIVNAKPYVAVKGRVFLILNLKIVNDQNKKVDLNTADYVRLSINGNTNDKLAPEIHNDPVTVQAISTKYSRVGFTISETDKDLILKLGQLDGDKQDIALKF